MIKLTISLFGEKRDFARCYYFETRTYFKNIGNCQLTYDMPFTQN